MSVLNHPDHVLAAAFSADGTQIASVARDKTIRVFDARSGDLLHVNHYHFFVMEKEINCLGCSMARHTMVLKPLVSFGLETLDAYVPLGLQSMVSAMVHCL